MSPRITLSLVFSTLALVAPLLGQQNPTGSSRPLAVQRDPQAVALLTQALNAAGGTAAVGTIQDFTGTGSVTFYWAGQDVTGSIIFKGRGTAQFRFDATTASGNLTVIDNNGSGSVARPDGTTAVPPLPATLNLGSATLPALNLVEALGKSSMSILNQGSSMYDGTQVTVVRVERALPSTGSSNLIQDTASVRDFFIDTSTYAILGVRDRAYPKDGVGPTIPHDWVFSNYQNINGVLVPFALKEEIGGQVTMTVQLTQVTFNTGLSDSDFQQ